MKRYVEKLQMDGAARRKSCVYTPVFSASASLRLTLLALICATASPVAAFDLLWAHQFNSTDSTGFIGAYGGAADASGIYASGSVFGDLPGATTLGGEDAYVRKLNQSGAVLWTHRFGTTNDDGSIGVVTDADGVYTTGYTLSTFPGQVRAGSFDAYVAKLSPDGALVWATQFGTSRRDFPYQYGGITVHASGVYVAGKTAGTFPGGTPASGPNTFLARFDRTTGALLWVRQFGAADPTFFTVGGVGADDTGVAVVANSELSPGTPSTLPKYMAEVRKYGFDGTLQWSRVFNTNTTPCGHPVFNISSHRGKVYLIGQTTEWGLTDCGVPPLGQAYTIGLLQNLDANGNTVWQRHIKAENTGAEGGLFRFTGAKVVHATDQGIFVGANVRNADFAGYVTRTPRSDRSQCSDPGALENTAFKGFDGYVRRYDLNGNVLWTHQFGSSLFEIVSGLGSDGAQVYGAGLTRCVVAEGADPETGALVDAFVVSFAIDPTTQSGRVHLIVGQIETLSDAGRIASGDFNALVNHLERALAALHDSKTSVAKSSLEAFVTLVENYQATDRLTATEAGALSSAASAIANEL